MSKKDLSRRDFLRGTAAGAAGLAMMGVLSACGSDPTPSSSPSDSVSPSTSPSPSASAAANTYIPGTYSATATGLGTVTVTMTFDASSITDVKVDTSNETLDLAINSAGDFQSALMAAQSAEVDTISGATFTSDAVREAAAKCINQALGLSSGDEDSAKPSAGAAALGYPSCEDLSDVNAATNSGPIAFVSDPIADADIKETVNVDVLVCGQGPAGMATALACAQKGLKVVHTALG